LFVCLFVFVCLLATLRKNFRTDLHEIFWEGWRWANEQNDEILMLIWITDSDTDPDTDPDPDRDTSKTALAAVCTMQYALSQCF